ncbi:porin [Aquincola sp. J276]|uniref:porin n=1 Tax=Aquincola sp. J276 TaxID=2898432 RepID=UPI002150EA92|nr:porin [Aquincola sp. J276]MCR5868914.1 porin [Aquincola sp. J276]
MRALHFHHRHAAGAALAATAIAAPALAQSSVTLSGIVDLAARTVHNEGLGSMQSLVSGSNATSRLVIRGTEDLGGGLSAGFHLEHGIAADAGTAVQATQFWDRRSTLSLAAKAWGELRAGRDFVPSYTGWSRFDPFSYVGVAGSNNLVAASQRGPIRSAFGTTANTTVRSSNAVQWLLPTGLAGLEGGVMLAAGEGGAAGSGQYKLAGARIGWAGGAWVLSAAHTATEPALPDDERFHDTALGASYALGFGRLSLAVRRFELPDARQLNLLVGLVVPVGAHELKFSFNRADFSGRVGTAGIGGNEARQWGLGYVHNLSRRSALYATASVIDNRGGASFSVPGGPAGLAGGQRSTGAEAGIRHTF